MAANTANVSCLHGCLSSVQVSSMQCCGASCLWGGSTQAPVRKLKWFEVVPWKLEAASWNVRMKTTRQLIPWLWILWTYFFMIKTCFFSNGHNMSTHSLSTTKTHSTCISSSCSSSSIPQSSPEAAMASTPWEAYEASARNASSKMPNRNDLHKTFKKM